MRKIIFLIVLISNIGAYAQKKEFPDVHCTNSFGNKLDEDNILKDSIYVIYSKSDSILYFNIANTTKDTIYLFRSYFYDLYYSSNYLHRLDTVNKLYKVSFLPLIPFLNINASDVVKLSKERIVKPFQVLYDFIILPPMTHYKIEISYKALFSNLNEKDVFVNELNPYIFSKFDNRINFDFINLNMLTKEYKLIFEFAYYKDICLLCDKDAYYYNEFEFDKQAKSFKIIKLPVQLDSFEHPIIK